MNLKGVHMLKRIKKLAKMIKDRTSYRGLKMEPYAVERRTFLLTAVWLGAMALFRGLFPRGPETAEAAVGIKKGESVPTVVTGAQQFSAGVRSLVVEGGTNPGDVVTVKMIIDTSGRGIISVPWNIYRGNTILKSEIRHNIAAGTSFEVSATWQASSGIHNFYGDVDPQNSLRKPLSGQRDNISKTVTRSFSDWAGWLAGAKRGIREGVPQWVASLKFSGISINGPIASGGRLESSSDLKSLISIRMREAGAPQDVVEGFMGAVAESWNSWAGSVRVPGLPWYPSFAAVPSPVAPPTPNIPSPLVALTQNRAPLEPLTLAAAIKGRIRDAASWPGGNNGIDEFCRWLNAGFITWLPKAKVQGVLGTGPVPSFAPPYVPVGPVVGGHNAATPGIISPAPIWP